MAIKATLKKPKRASDAPPIDVESSTSTDLEAAVANEQGAAPTEPTTAVATRPKLPPPAKRTDNPAGLSGDWDAIPAKLPQIKLVQGSGKLAKDFNVGTILFDGVELMPPVNKAKKEAPHIIRFVPVVLDLQFKERLSDEAIKEGQIPQTVNSVREVYEAGGTTEWGPAQTPPDNYWAPAARNVFLVERPEGSDHPGFGLDLDGKQFAIAVYYTAGGAFRNCSKLIRDALNTKLFVPVIGADNKPEFKNGFPVKRKLIYKCFWTISWDIVQAGKFTPYQPQALLLKEETGPEVREYCEVLHANAAAVAAAALVADEE